MSDDPGAVGPGTIEEAIILACRVHAGQVDKAGAPYILHPLRVMLAMAEGPARFAAILHDVVEDGDVAPAEIAARFGSVVAAAVVALSRRPDESYEAFIERCAADPVARAVKLADLADNLDLSRIPAPTSRDHARADKYRRSLDRLHAIATDNRHA